MGKKKRRGRMATRLEILFYFQASIFDRYSGHVLGIYFRHGKKKLEGIWRFRGLDKNFGKGWWNGSE
jgi:hypothetical protein